MSAPGKWFSLFGSRILGDATTSKRMGRPLQWTAEVIWWRNDYWKAMTYTPHTALQSFKIYWQIQIQKNRSNTNTNTLTYQIQITIGKL